MVKNLAPLYLWLPVRLQLLHDGVVTTEDVGAVWVSAAVSFDGIAVAGLSRGDEQGHHQVGFGGRRGDFHA